MPLNQLIFSRTALSLAALGILTALLAGCATPRPATPAPLAELVPAAWQAPLPHGGRLQALKDWWQQREDPALSALVEAALADSPTLAAAQARVEQARAQTASNQAALMPRLDLGANASRGNSQSVGSVSSGSAPPVVTSMQVGLQAGWEIDLFGRQSSLLEAAERRQEGAEAVAHLARVSLVADVANAYYGLRLCQSLLVTAENDTASRSETARLAIISRDAGFTAPATAALAEASAADGRARTLQQRTACDAQIKQLVALTGLDEPGLRSQVALQAVSASQGNGTNFSVASIPADALRQRPDIWAAEREVLATRAEVGSAEAARLPSLSLGGSISRLQLQAMGASGGLGVWSLGPLALNLPLFDGGRIAAGTQAARARYDEAAANYRAKIRQAVQEVETALVQGADAEARTTDARAAVAGYQQSFDATQALYRQGMTNLVQLEEARRNLLAAQTALQNLRHDQQAAWVALYRAAGGGWQAP
ncbi:efflux transporter outer membrane subunit [Ottowia thiooxydans]|uniref:efflux transporter outer membrane subunit n=1 Tax=Ottowia thiooxydans TaxID=219182 RepID=UPI000411FA3B|nr:efflux transporter outer membrane subunit [Ottowia thiooxydans]